MRKTAFPIRILLLCVLAVGLPIEPAEAAKLKDEVSGFNGYILESALSDYPSLKLVKDLGSTDFVQQVGVYGNPDEALRFNAIPLTKIRYRFVDGQLESIAVYYVGRENRDKLMKWVEEQYGKLSSHERRMVSNVQWFGDKTTITLNYNPDTKLGTLWFISQVLAHRLNEFHQATQGD
jgi:hypothetical protein